MNILPKSDCFTISGGAKPTCAKEVEELNLYMVAVTHQTDKPSLVEDLENLLQAVLSARFTCDMEVRAEAKLKAKDEL